MKPKQALVTGGSGDIGRAICCRLAADNIQVAFSYFSDHDGAKVTADAVQAIQKAPPKIFRVNFGQPKSTQAFLDEVAQTLPSIDHLVHNAASGVFRDATALEPRHMAWAMEVNANALLAMVQRFSQRPDNPILGTGSTIVALSSLGAGRAIPQYTALAASKAALEAIARHLALELGRQGIRVNVISPGLVPTRALEHFPNREHLMEVAQTRTPLGRLCTPEDVADVVGFLCSPQSAMIHGQTLHVDGGYNIVG